MHRLIFGHSFIELVALILLPGLAFYFINKKKASVHSNAKNADTGAFGSLTMLTENNSGRSSSTPAETNTGASSSSPTETTGGCSSSPTETKSSGSSLSPIETDSGASSLSLSPAETNSSGSSLPPTETNNGATSLSLTSSKFGGSSSSPTKTYNDASSSSLSPIETNFGGSSSSSTRTNNSASNSLTGNHYEVFLSFRGPDTRYGFTDHLYKRLLDAGIDAFRDDDELCHGEDIGPMLMEAITSSKILIPIFSVNYGTSSWCLDELVQIMERKNKKGQMVLPIFYKVKPADVGHQIGSFGEAFHRREKRLLGRSSFDAVTLEKWTKALLEVSTLKGYEAQGSEVELVKSIVRKVLNELKKKFELDISKNLVGIDVHVKKVMEFVDNKSHDTLFVGIHGMGGIGKTTLAKAIYNKFSNEFEHCSFIADIRESWKRNGIHYLQNQLIYDVLKLENEVRYADEGINFISSRFKSKKVLVLLDDVDDVVQLRSLAGNHDWFYSGSKIIITTRYKRVLEEAGVDHDYEHKEMDYNQSLILFSKHAFRRDSPSREFEDLTHEVVSITRGLPLSLEVFGSLLCGKESRQWRDTIKKLKKVPPKKVQEKLRISYEALDYEQKQIFLHIACHFIGTYNRVTSYMWDACDFYPGEGIEVLIFMSLIKVGDDHRLIMHDQLKDLGRKIVREINQQEPWCRSRLWDYEEAQKVPMENKMAEKLKYLDLSNCDSWEDTDFLSPFKKLEVLILTGCRRLKRIDASIGDMKALLCLELCGCRSLTELPATIGNLENLEILDISSSGIEVLPNGIGSLRKLRELYASNCRNLKGEMAESMCNLSSLQRLDFLRCYNLQLLLNLPSNLIDLGVTCRSCKLPWLSHLTNLQVLQVYRCEFLECIQVLSSTLLRNSECSQPMDVEESKSQQSLNTSFKLEFLDVQWCRSIEIVDISQFIHLRTLSAKYCNNLLEVRGLDKSKYLESLFIVKCNSIKRLDLLKFKGLKTLNVRSCEKLVEIQCLDKLKNLESINIQGCTSIKMLDLPKFGSLKELNVQRCENLIEIQGLDRLEVLQSVNISSCIAIGKLLLPKPGSLKILYAQQCKKLAEIQGLDSSEYLERLDIKLCTSIRRLLLPKFGRLKELEASECKNLAEIQDLNGLEFLERLDIFKCTSIGRLDLPKSKSLKELKVEGCKNLTEIQCLNSKYLERLYIKGCTSIERLLLPNYGRLKELEARDCQNLVEIQGLNRSGFLERLDIFKCSSIERLDLPESRSLKILYAKSCKGLAEIQGLESLEFLERLDISKCTSIERLLLPKSENLKILKARDCKNLVKIQGLDRLKFLEELNLIGCESLEPIPELRGTRVYRYYEIAYSETIEYGLDYTEDSDESI